jgi:hypothetical protein
MEVVVLYSRPRALMSYRIWELDASHGVIAVVEVIGCLRTPAIS